MGSITSGFNPEFFNDVAFGNVPGYRAIVVESENADIDLIEEDLWEPGGFLNYLTSAETVTVVSDSANDTVLGGTGAQVIFLEGLDTNYQLISEVVVLLGTTPVVTVNSFLRVHLATVVLFGTGEFNDGKITFTATTSAITHTIISPGVGQSRNNQITVPDKEECAVNNLQFGVVNPGGSGKAIFTVKGYARLFQSGWWFQTFKRTIRSEVDSGFEAFQVVQPEIPEKSDLRVTVQSDSVNSACNFRAYLIFKSTDIV